MQDNLISVIVPVYNIEKYVKRCIDSILKQTYQNLEIIIVDDGSTDSSPDICDSYMDQRVRVIHKSNGGLGFARNSGLEIATGEYITFVDGDDEIQENHIEKMVQQLVIKEADTCICGYSRICQNRKIPYVNVFSGKTFEGNDILKYVLPRMLGNEPGKKDNIEMSVCMQLFSNEIIRVNNIKFPSERDYISEDLVFDFIYYQHCKKVTISDGISYFYYDNPGSLTTKYNPNRFILQKKLSTEEIMMVKKLGIEKECLPRIYNTFLGIARYSIKLEVKFSNQNGLIIAYRNILKTCKDEMLNETIDYFWNKPIPIKNRMVLILIKYRCVLLLFAVMKLKNDLNV